MKIFSCLARKMEQKGGGGGRKTHLRRKKLIKLNRRVEVNYFVYIDNGRAKVSFMHYSQLSEEQRKIFQ